ncbi:MAG: hypothetical protein H7210_13500 [Pyrinomonadaceae bacterium]|nr:hypothetical protein [Phycisphaerales bacterium]
MPPTAQTAGLKRFPCKQCGAILEYAVGTDTLKCRYCGATQEIPKQDPAQIVEQDFLGTLSDLSTHAEMTDVTIVKCDSCAAEVTKPPEVTSLTCPYCNSNIVAQPMSKRIIRPHALLPFKVPSEQALKLFRDWVNSRWFAPNRLKEAATLQGRLAGIYVPYWTYDSDTVTHYSGLRGEFYYVTVGSGNNRRTEQRVRWYPASGTVYNSFDDVLIVAGTSLPEKYVEKLDPWDLESLVPYTDDYLSGFRAETYKMSLADGFANAKVAMDPTIRSTICADIGGDTQQISSMDVSYNNITFKHLLLPVWVSAYRYGQKVFRFLVNARTGEVQGERPYSPIKIALAVIAGLIVAAIIAFFVNER